MVVWCVVRVSDLRRVAIVIFLWHCDFPRWSQTSGIMVYRGSGEGGGGCQHIGWFYSSRWAMRQSLVSCASLHTWGLDTICTL